jgi:hypothetical protein
MKILCFSPNDAIWLWTFSQANFLETLQNRGDEITYLYCDRTLCSYCTVMAVHGLMPTDTTQKKDDVCRECVSSSSLVRRKYGFTGVALHSLLEKDDYEEADALSGAKSVDDLIKYRQENLEIGKIALYEAVIQSKHIKSKIDGLAEVIYRPLFRNSLLVAKATRRILDFLKPEVCVSYHTAYAYNRTFEVVAESSHVPVYSVTASFNMDELDSHLVAYRGDPLLNLKRLVKYWPEIESQACSKHEINTAATHIKALLSGRGYAFSVAVQSSANYIATGVGKLVLVVLSSYDELIAAELAGFPGWSTRNDTFDSQVDWVEWILEFAAKRADTQFVIRVHPREFPINGQGRKSEHVDQLMKAFAKRTPNVHINMPADRVPLYDLMLRADAVLVSWSSAGMEAGMFGIPVVTYFGESLAYPPSLLYEARTREEYREKVCEALQRDWSFEQSRQFFRWAVLLLVRSRIRVTPEGLVRNPLYKIVKRTLRYMRRKIMPWSDQEWQVALRWRTLPEKDKVYQLIDGRFDGFYSIPNDQPQVIAREVETRYLIGALEEIACIYEKKSGTRAVKLRQLLKKADQSI